MSLILGGYVWTIRDLTVPMVTFLMKYWVVLTGLGLFIDRGTNRACLALLALRTIGNWDASIHPHFQSIFGCRAANHE